MLLSVFSIGLARYALKPEPIVEVLPLIHIEPIPHAPPEVAGSCNYRGVPVLVLDLCRIVGQPPAQPLLSTRLIIVRQGQQLFAILAAGFSETVRVDPKDFIVETDPTPYRPAWHGPRAVYGTGFLQCLELEPLARQFGAAA
jgi:chemotaxis-related protein WspB